MGIIKTLTDESGTYDVEIVIESDGWSGTPLIVRDGTERFQFDITGRIEGGSELFTCEPSEGNYGHWRYSSTDTGSILGMSLEHMGLSIDSDGEPCFQAVGLNPYWRQCGAWGAKPSDAQLRIEGGNISVHSLELYVDGDDVTYTEETLGRYFQYRNNVGIIFWRCQYAGSGSWKWRATIKTDLPIFETDADLLEYCQSGGTVTNKILNLEGNPEEDYKEQFTYHYVNNIYGHNTRTATAYTGFRNYRFFPKSKRMCFYRVRPTESSPYTVRLMGYDSSVVVKSAPAYGSSDDDYETISGRPELYYLHKSISFADNDYYTKFKFSTDLLVYGNETDAQDYIDGVGDPRLAENFNDVSRQYNEFVDPGYGNPDTGNDHGKNGINYSRGSTLWKLTETEMHTFFGDIFNTANINDILSNTQLFGANQINSILGVAYYPFDVEEVCRLDSSKKIYVGSWECPNATGKRVLFNYDLLDCGSIAIPRVYNDYRDYEMEIYISLPYVGVHKLNTALYMGAASLHIYYAVDVSTGCCTAHLHVTNETLTDCEIDSWDGFISSMRPISAVDQQAYISGVMGNVTSIFNRETGMVNDATQAIGGVMTGNVKGALSSGVGPGYGFSQSAGAIGDIYGLSQAVRDVPISTRGGFSGALGMFGNQKIHIITAQKRKTVPDNKLLTVGLPSNIGGRVGLFSGFLSVSAFTMADGFTGTAEELREIESIMANGIFL